MKIKLIAIVLLVVLFGPASCKKGNPTPVPPIPAAPAITGISPDNGPAGTVVTIAGSNFGTDASVVKVFFNNVAATVQSVANAQVIAAAPAGAGTGAVKVQVGSQVATGPAFTYTLPVVSISSINPASGTKNTSVTITGNNFGTDTTVTKVFFNGVAASVQSITNTQIVALVPAKAGTGIVKVQLNAQTANGPIFTYTPAYIVTTMAGDRNRQGFADGPGNTAMFNSPVGIAVDAQGNVFVADATNQRIRKITPANVVSTFAGSAQQGFNDGTGAAAQFYFPQGLAIDATGNMIVTDSRSHLIRKVTPAAVVTTLAGNIVVGFTDGTGSAAQFNNPVGASIDAQGNAYIVDWNNHSIRKVTPAGVVTTLAGNGTAGYADGTGAAARFRFPYGVTTDAAGNVYVADDQNNRIRKITPAGVVTTIAGDGTFGYADGNANVAKFAFPSDVKIDAQGNIFVADRGNHCIRKITAAGVVSTIAGVPTLSGFLDGGPGTARFNQPYGLAMDAQGNMYVSDYLNYSIRKVTLE